MLQWSNLKHYLLRPLLAARISPVTYLRRHYRCHHVQTTAASSQTTPKLPAVEPQLEDWLSKLSCLHDRLLADGWPIGTCSPRVTLRVRKLNSDVAAACSAAERPVGILRCDATPARCNTVPAYHAVSPVPRSCLSSAALSSKTTCQS